MTEEKTTFCADCWHRYSMFGLEGAKCLSYPIMTEERRLIGVWYPEYPFCTIVRSRQESEPICSKFEPCDTFWKKVKRWWRDACHQN